MESGYPGNVRVVDSKSEDYYRISPYAYCAANPVNLVDPDGERPRIYVSKSGWNKFRF